MARRLVRRERATEAERFQNSTKRQRISEAHARGRQILKKSPRPATVAQIVGAFIKSKSQGCIHSRIVAREIIEKTKGQTVAEVTTLTANEMIAGWRNGHRLAQSTQHSRRRALKEILHYLQLCGASATLTMGLTTVTKPPARKVRATDDELTRILDTAEPWMRCFCIIAGHHGLRLSEALRLSAAHYNATERTISYGTKKFQDNTLPVSDELAEYFRTAPNQQDRDTPLIWRLRGKPLSLVSFYKYWYRMLKDAKVNPSLHPHDLRRTIALNAWSKTRDLKICQAILGHKSLASTAIYLEGWGNPELRQVMRGLTIGTPAQKPGYQN